MAEQAAAPAEAKEFGKTSTAMEAANGADLSGQTMVLTGCNTGIGKETARVLALCGAKIFMCCRNQDKAAAAREDIIKSIQESKKDFDGSSLVLVPLDLSSLASVRKCAFEVMQQLKDGKLNRLICNAGIMNLPEKTMSTDDLELMFACNHIGHSYLAILLTPALIAAAPSRLVIVSSGAAMMAPKLDWIDEGLKAIDGPEWLESKIKGWDNYAISKACSLLFTRAYNDEYFAKSGVTAVCLHPGVIATELQRHCDEETQKYYSQFLNKSIPQGASTTIRCVVMSDEEIKPGHYYSDCQDAQASVRKDLQPLIAKAENEEKEEASNGKCQNAQKVWQWTNALLNKKGFALDLKDYK